VIDRTDKEDRWDRVAIPRFDRLHDELRKLANCANRSNYDWDQTDTARRLKSLRTDVVITATLFGVDLSPKPVAAPTPAPQPTPPMAHDARAITGLHERSWSAWALDKLQHGDVDEAILMLKKGLRKQ